MNINGFNDIKSGVEQLEGINLVAQNLRVRAIHKFSGIQPETSASGFYFLSIPKFLVKELNIGVG